MVMTVGLLLRQENNSVEGFAIESKVIEVADQGEGDVALTMDDVEAEENSELTFSSETNNIESSTPDQEDFAVVIEKEERPTTDLSKSSTSAPTTNSETSTPVASLATVRATKTAKRDVQPDQSEAGFTTNYAKVSDDITPPMRQITLKNNTGEGEIILVADATKINTANAKEYDIIVENLKSGERLALDGSQLNISDQAMTRDFVMFDNAGDTFVFTQYGNLSIDGKVLGNSTIASDAHLSRRSS